MSIASILGYIILTIIGVWFLKVLEELLTDPMYRNK